MAYVELPQKIPTFYDFYSAKNLW